MGDRTFRPVGNPFTEDPATRTISHDELAQLLEDDGGTQPRAVWEFEETRSVALPQPDSVWYAWANEEQQGPLSTTGLDEALHAGRIDASTLVWRDGLGDWTRAGDVPELQVLLSAAAQAIRRTPVAPLQPRPSVSRAGLDVEALFADLDPVPGTPKKGGAAALPWATEAGVAPLAAMFQTDVPSATQVTDPGQTPVGSAVLQKAPARAAASVGRVEITNILPRRKAPQWLTWQFAAGVLATMVVFAIAWLIL